MKWVKVGPDWSLKETMPDGTLHSVAHVSRIHRGCYHAYLWGTDAADRFAARTYTRLGDAKAVTAAIAKLKT